MSVYPSLEDMKVDHMMQVFRWIQNSLNSFTNMRVENQADIDPSYSTHSKILFHVTFISWT